MTALLPKLLLLLSFQLLRCCCRRCHAVPVLKFSPACPADQVAPQENSSEVQRICPHSSFHESHPQLTPSRSGGGSGAGAAASTGGGRWLKAIAVVLLLMHVGALLARLSSKPLQSLGSRHKSCSSLPGYYHFFFFLIVCHTYPN